MYIIIYNQIMDESGFRGKTDFGDSSWQRAGCHQASPLPATKPAHCLCACQSAYLLLKMMEQLGGSGPGQGQGPGQDRVQKGLRPVSRNAWPKLSKSYSCWEAAPSIQECMAKAQQVMIATNSCADIQYSIPELSRS